MVFTSKRRILMILEGNQPDNSSQNIVWLFRAAT